MKLIVFTEDDNWFKALKSTFKGHSLARASYRDELLTLSLDSDLMILDMEQAGHYGPELISDILDANPSLGIIVVIPISMLDAGVQAVQDGAAFYLTKPLDNKALREQVEKLADKRRRRTAEEPGIEEMTRQMFVGRSPQMERVMLLVNKVSATESTVLITGESGTGKELVARLIHQQSRRVSGPLVSVNCGAIHENLIESELFGHLKGSFTGAIADKEGLFEVADGGTLFLDEVGELPLSSQVKVLRFLQDRQIRRVGSTKNTKVDARILAATNRDLQAAIEEKAFREDLFFRLNVFRIHLPPLRERKDSLPHLIKYFIRLANHNLGTHVGNISREAQIVLAGYDFPGNIRELESAVMHAVTVTDGDIISLNDLPDHILTSGKKLPSGPDSGTLTLAEMEKIHIKKVLEKQNGNKGEAASILGVSRSTLWRKLKELGI